MATSFDLYVYSKLNRLLYLVKSYLFNDIEITNYIKSLIFHNASILPYKTVTSDYTLTGTDYAVYANATSGGITITLPDPSNYPGKIFFIKKIDSSDNSVTVSASNSTIDNLGSVPLTDPYQIIAVQSISDKWMIIWR